MRGIGGGRKVKVRLRVKREVCSRSMGTDDWAVGVGGG